MMSGAVDPKRKKLVVDDNLNIKGGYESLIDYFNTTVQVHGDRKALGTRVGDAFEWMDYTTLGRDVEKFRNVLHHHNIGRNDAISIISNNRVEWVVAWYAAVSLGAQVVPMYEAQLEKDWRYIVEDSGSTMVLCANEAIYSKVKSYVNSVGNVKSALVFDASDDDRLYSYKRWMASVDGEQPVDAVSIKPDDVASIIYTSGTTGNPKGVELSMNNLKSNLDALADLWSHELRNENVSLAFLPWAHVFGQTAELHSAMRAGSAMAIVADREQILESFQMVKPSILVSVPALFNRIYDSIMSKVGEAPPLRQKIFQAARKAKRAFNDDLEFGRTPNPWTTFKANIADKVVFSKIRDVLGGNIRWTAAGGAATSTEVAQFFEDMGVPICEGYGLTETSPVITAGNNSWTQRRLGTSGVVLKDITVRIVDPETLEELPPGIDGEVTCSGPNVMIGYRNNEEANKEVLFHKDGKRWFRTGDLGHFVEGKFLKITGRIKEQYKLENGKYVVPAPLEDMLCRSRFILQTFIHGDNMPSNVVLVVPDMVQLEAWAEKNSPLGENETPLDLLHRDEVLTHALLTTTTPSFLLLPPSAAHFITAHV
jgi:long-chain acyl-CoA synthetase